MPRLSLLLALLLLSGCATSRVDLAPDPSAATAPQADVQAGERLYPIVVAGQWGYVDRGGQVVILPRYEAASDFSEGRAAVREDGKWGYIAPNGQWVVRPRYVLAGAYAEGRARIAVGRGEGRRFGYLDPAGAEVVAPVLPYALDYTEGLALVRLTENRQTAFQRALARLGALGDDSGFAFLTRDGVVAFEVPGVSAAAFSGGLAPFEQDRGWFRSTTWGYLDRTGGVAVAADLDGPAFRHSDGLARVGRDGQMGFVNRQGTFVIEPAYALALAFAEGLAPVQDDEGRWGFVDETGAIAIEPRFRSALPFAEGRAVVQTEAGWGFITPDGSLAIAPAYTRAESFRGGLARVYQGRLLRYIDADGTVVWAQP